MGVQRKPWAGIVRVSHMGDRKPGAANVHADREQVGDLEAQANRMGVTLDLLPAELDVSGRLPLKNRPSLRVAVEGVESGKYGGIIVAYLSRLGRNVREQLDVWDRVESAGGRIIVVRENIDTSTPSGRYVRTILLANAERELEEHTERFENLREWATAAGIWQRRQTPRGYRRDPTTRKLVPDENADEVRKIFLRRAAGDTISQLAREVGMTQAGLRGLLGNRVYLGELIVGRHTNPSAHPPLVSEDEWLAVQRLHAPSRPARSTEPISLLAGLVRCGSCGHAMSRASGGRGHRVYACHRHHSAGSCPRPAAITCATLDEYVKAIARRELSRLSATVTDSGRDVREARAALTGAEEELAAYLEGVTAAGLSPGEYANGAHLRSKAVEDARERVAEVLARRPALVDGDPIAAWKRMDPNQRNRLLRSLIECVIVAPVGRGRRVAVADRTRVMAFGSGVVPRSRGGSRTVPIRNLGLPDLDDPGVLRMHLGEDLLEGASR